jgi:hypothetical protein
MLRSTALTLCLSIGFTLTSLAMAAVTGVLQATTDDKTALLRHVVLFKVAEVVAAVGALPGKIDAIRGYEWGTDVSVEMKSQGFTHCFVVSFANVEGRDAYLPHAAHNEFVKLAGPRIDKVLVFDYVIGK